MYYLSSKSRYHSFYMLGVTERGGGGGGGISPPPSVFEAQKMPGPNGVKFIISV